MLDLCEFPGRKCHVEFENHNDAYDQSEGGGAPERLIAVPARMDCTWLGFGKRIHGTFLLQGPRPD